MTFIVQGLNNSDVDFDTTWAVLERAFKEIHTKNASALSFEELYRNAYKIVLKKKGEELYNRVAAFEADWLGNQVRGSIVRQLTHPLITLTDGSGRSLSTSAERKAAGESFLRTLKEAWEDHQICMGMLTDVLMYMVSEDHLLVGMLGKADVVGEGSGLLHRPSTTIHLRKSHGSLPRPDPTLACSPRLLRPNRHPDFNHSRRDTNAP